MLELFAHHFGSPRAYTTPGSGTPPAAAAAYSRGKWLRALRYIAAAPLVLVVAALGYVVVILELVLRLLADRTLRIMPKQAAVAAAERKGPVQPGNWRAEPVEAVILPFHRGVDMSASRHSSPGKSRDFTGGDAA